MEANVTIHTANVGSLIKIASFSLFMIKISTHFMNLIWKRVQQIPIYNLKRDMNNIGKSEIFRCAGST